MSGVSQKYFAVQKNTLDAHLRLLSHFAILLRVFVAIIALLASYAPQFDSSADILLPDASKSLFKRWIAVSFRWDAFHFLHIAHKSYAFEHEWAFFPGVPFISYISGWMLTLMQHSPSIYSMLLGHFLLSTLLSAATVQTLYVLTLEHTGSTNVALLSACLSLLSSSPVTLTLAPYAEPWFAFLSYKGMLSCVRKRWTRASAFFALASMFRSNGIFLSGFIIWGTVIEPFVALRRISFLSFLSCFALSTLPVLPYIALQAAAYKEFCIPESPMNPPWCTYRVPLIYNYVQSHYWNVGFLRYWTVQQLPNFFLAAPVLLLLLWSSLTHIKHTLTSTFLRRKSQTESLLVPSTLPHAIHALITTCLLLFASHTQIILRLASSMPFTYWSGARLFSEHRRLARWWVAWSLVWGTMSIVLWTAFLPPA